MRIIDWSSDVCSSDLAWVERVARAIDIPFCVAGGIGDVASARRVLQAGADKVSVNTPALERPALISELADAFGVQCVVVGIDSQGDLDWDWRVRRHTGAPNRMRTPGWPPLHWVIYDQRLDAGAIVLDRIDRDGGRFGYDFQLLPAVRVVVHLPMTASCTPGQL